MGGDGLRQVIRDLECGDHVGRHHVLRSKGFERPAFCSQLKCCCEARDSNAQLLTSAQVVLRSEGFERSAFLPELKRC